MNCRDIPDLLWLQARDALIIYFRSRHGHSNAEDLAQETLSAILSREDYTFVSQQDFLKVCYGFASRISLWAYRKAAQRSGYDTETLESLAAMEDSAGRLSGLEVKIYLKQIIEIGEYCMSEKQWDLILGSTEEDRSALIEQFQMGSANNLRVFLHRARRKLVEMTGWDPR